MINDACAPEGNNQGNYMMDDNKKRNYENILKKEREINYNRY